MILDEQCERILKVFGKDLSNQFSNLKSNEERIKFLNDFAFVTNQIILPSKDQIPVKSNAKALELRKKGNDFFRRANHQQAFIEYTRSCCYVQTSSGVDTGGEDNLSISIANRSAVFYRMKKYEESLNDINLAINNGYPEYLKYKLFERRGDCLTQLMKTKEAFKAYEQSIDYLKLSKLDETIINKHLKILQKKMDESSKLTVNDKSKNKKDDLIKTIIKYPKTVPILNENINKVFTSLSDSCDVVNEEDKGRSIRARRDIQPGEIILVEKPFASILLPEQYLTHCYVCLNPAFNSIPCSKCVFVVFCSEECRKKSLENFHKHECSIIGYFINLDMYKLGPLILRTVLNLSPKSVMKYTKTNIDRFIDHEKKVVLNAEKQYTWNDYSTICNLVTNDNKRTGKYLFEKSIKAQILLKLLEKTDYFNDITDENELRNIKIQVTTLMLYHYLAFPCNAHQISEFRLDAFSVQASLLGEVGTGIYSTLSLFNHSCDPLVTRDFYGDVCVVRAIGYIKKGFEVSDDYGIVFQMATKKERQKILSPQYCFQCSCEACKYDWPVYSVTYDDTIVFLCDNCYNPLPINADRNVIIVICSHCKSSHNMVTKTLSLKNCGEKFQKSLELLLNFRPAEALPGIIEYITNLSKMVNKPLREFTRGQETLKQCYSMLSNCIKLEN